MDLIVVFVQNIVPIFSVAGIGYLLMRYVGVDVKTLSRVSLYALSPCLVFNMLVTCRIGVDEFTRLALFALGTILGLGMIALVVTRALRLEREMVSAFLVVVMFANGGNYGLPLTLFAFGQDALSRSAIYLVMNMVLTYTLGIFLASSGRSSTGKAVKGIFKIPSVYAVIAGIAVIAVGINPPPVVMRPIKLLSDSAIPVMLMVLGMQLKGAGSLEKPQLVGLAVAMRLIVSVFLGFLMVHLVGLAGVAKQAGMIQTAMPVAVVTTILAVEFEVEPRFVTSVVFVSTILSPLTVTPLIAFLK